MEDDLDRILSTDQDVVPSLAFVGNVMAAVRREASAPAPISFPWLRVVPGFAICAVALTAFLVIAGIQYHGGATVAGPIPHVIVNIVQTMNRVGIGWIALALVATLSGKAMARTGLRMMPTFPSPPLKFRTAGFPQYGFKAGLSEGAFPARRPIVAPSWFASLLRAPRFQTCLSPLGVGAVVRWSAAIRATVVALPQGSSLRSEF